MPTTMAGLVKVSLPWSPVSMVARGLAGRVTLGSLAGGCCRLVRRLPWSALPIQPTLLVLTRVPGWASRFSSDEHGCQCAGRVWRATGLVPVLGLPDRAEQHNGMVVLWPESGAGVR